MFILETNRIGDKSSKNFCYQNIVYANRKFNMSYTSREALNRENIYYYCKYHRTTKNSSEITNKNLKKKISICNAKILYKKNEQMYFWCTDHSEECNRLYNQNISIPSNFKNNINNYEEFKKNLTDYLNKNPIINYTDFLKYATDLYYKIECTFEIKNYTFCNIYYSWRKKSNTVNLIIFQLKSMLIIK